MLPGAPLVLVGERHAQVERGGLVYIAHQLDFVGEILVPKAPK